jgi:hypothetical protein
MRRVRNVLSVGGHHRRRLSWHLGSAARYETAETRQVGLDAFRKWLYQVAGAATDAFAVLSEVQVEGCASCKRKKGTAEMPLM